MDLILVKIFATALALSEVMTQPQAVKTHFDAVAEQDKVVQTLRAGCAHMRRAFDIESINVDDLISTALNDQKAVGTDIKAFHGINFADLNVAYHRFCKNENVDGSMVDLGEVIEFFNDAAADLPDHARLKGRKLPSMTAILDGKGANFADVFEPSNRRIWVSLDDIPESVQKAFVAAEDRRFYQHHGVDERGIIRAFMGNLGESGRPQGGSTITQQVVKNLLVGEDVTYERKIREIIVASRVESTLTKAEILELYLNSAYLGRSSWGVEMAARSYFGKSAKALTLGEGAMLAGLLKGPNFFNPDRRPERAKERLAYVLGRMQEDGVISPEQRAEALAAPPKIAALERQRRNTGFHFVDFLGREAKADGVESLTAQPYTVHSTINATLQRDTEAALQEGLAHYEIEAGRVQFHGPEANIADAVQKLSAGNHGGGAPSATADAAPGAMPAWQQALAKVHLPLYDVHWEPAVISKRQAWRRGAPRWSRRRPHPAPGNLRREDQAQPQPVRRRLCPRYRGQYQGHRATARAADGAGRGAGAGEQDGPYPRHGRELLVSLKPAQSHHADATSAGFGDQASDLSHGAAEGSPAEYSRTRRSNHAAAGRCSRQRGLRRDYCPRTHWCTRGGLLEAAKRR